MLTIKRKVVLPWKNCQPASQSCPTWWHISLPPSSLFQQILLHRLSSIRRLLLSLSGYSVKYTDENRSKSNNSMARKYESHSRPDVWSVWIWDFLLPVFVSTHIGSHTAEHPIAHGTRRYRYDHSVYLAKKICRRIPFFLPASVFCYICRTVICLSFRYQDYIGFPCLWLDIITSIIIFCIYYHP